VIFTHCVEVRTLVGRYWSQNISLKAAANAVKKSTKVSENKMLTKSVKHTTP